MKVSEHRYRQSRQGATVTSARSSKLVAFGAVFAISAIFVTLILHLTAG